MGPWAAKLRVYGGNEITHGMNVGAQVACMLLNLGFEAAQL